MDKAVIQGTFSEVKMVKTRSVVQMVIEVPIEQGAQIIAAFGFPRPGEEVPVAVARLDAEVAKAPPAALEKPKERFADKRLSVQAGIRCSDPTFWEFLRWRGYSVGGSEPGESAARAVRGICSDGHSRKSLDSDASYGERWLSLNAEYEKWSGRTAEQR